jgi:hypothetical protein
MKIRSHKELNVYNMAFDAAMEIVKIIKKNAQTTKRRLNKCT